VPEQDCLGVWVAAADDVAALTAAAPDLAAEWVHVAPSAVLRATRPDGHPRGCLHGVAIPRRHHDQLLERLDRLARVQHQPVGGTAVRAASERTGGQD
jgi:hypothetical protein